MRIEIAEPGRMTQSGSSLLRLIQNNDMPIIDLLVRESVQNSLDAYKDDEKYVNIEFITGKFKANELNKHLEGVEATLNTRYSSSENTFIAIKDSNTKGLTGKLHFDEVEQNDYGNLLKLVYEISKPQDSPGSGGSWGLGKTVYFRVGIGLVVYYSRIQNEQGNYESRLAVSLVEDEKDNNSMIPSYKGKLKRGIAWWGQSIGENKTMPLTDEVEIYDILKVFNISPYIDNQTGTTVIIPYIDEKKLLLSNKIEQKNVMNETINPYWYNNLEEYIKIAIQRWYAPRINNAHYKYGKWLRVLVNNQGISTDNMEPLFSIIQALYNRAHDINYQEDDILSGHDVKEKKVEIRNYLENKVSGIFKFIKLNRNMLKMVPPNNKYSPYLYINKENPDGDTNRPIVMFARKPGMIVSYELSGPWVDTVPSTSKDEFLIGIYVLNSLNKVKGMAEEISLEEYVRQSEMADHTSWGDWSNNHASLKIISKIQGHVRKAMINEYKEEVTSKEGGLNAGLGKLFGDLLLPPENFGKKPSLNNIGRGEKTGTVVKHKGSTLKIEKEGIKYFSEGINIGFIIKTNEKVSRINLDTYIATEVGKISVKEWEDELGQLLPFKLCASNLTKIKLDKNQIESGYSISLENPDEKNEYIDYSFIYSNKGVPYGIKILNLTGKSMHIEGSVTIKVNQKNIRTVLNLYTDEGDY